MNEFELAVKTESSASPLLLSPSRQFQFSFHAPPQSHARDSDPTFRFNLMPQSWPASNDDEDDVADLGSSAKHVRRRSSKACDQCRKSKCKCERSAPGEPCKSCVMLGTPCTFLGPSRKRGPPKGYIDAIEARLHQTEALLGILIASKDTRAQSLLCDIGKDILAKEIINRVDHSPYGVKGRKRGGEASTGISKLRPGQGHHHGSESESSRSSQKPELQPESPKLDLTSTHPSNEWQDRVTAMLNASSPSSPPPLGTGSTDAPDPQQQYQYPQVHPPQQQRLRTQQSEPSLTTAYTSSVPPNTSTHPQSHSHSLSHSDAHSSQHTIRPLLRVNLNDPTEHTSRRQRRRLDQDLDNDNLPYHTQTPHSEYTYSSTPVHLISTSRSASPNRVRYNDAYVHPNSASSSLPYTSLRRLSVSSTNSLSSADGDGDLTGAVGQLSLNEEEQVRYHGKASGLHLLGVKERVDGRNEGGIWRFPKARVWPMVPSGTGSGFGNTKDQEDELVVAQLPEAAVQEQLLELYFAFVHPCFPVVHKRAFFDSIKNSLDSPRTPDEIPTSSSTTGSPFNQRRQRAPTLLLLTMYALAARYSTASTGNTFPPPSDPSLGLMWAAGDEYLDRAKVLLDGTYATSRPSTCQALLLMGYREIGIGAMAQAWTYVGMAIRMAQDLGMHRSADGWARAELGGRLFGEWELQERRRVWYACVIMDKYVSTYIGRPLMIFESDFDTRLPSENDPEEMNKWSPSFLTIDLEETHSVPGRIISCFSASATLSVILGKIVQAIYAVHAIPNRHLEYAVLEGLLDRWYIELPQHLRFEPGTTKRPIPPPHFLTLHMQYWCAVLLLHRPFIRPGMLRNPRNEDSSEGEARKTSKKSYELCAGAANHITSIAMLYSDTYTLSRCSVFLCYYIFTASIMHVTKLTAYPSDPQARVGLSKCMEALRMMEIVWPSAGRALELLRGSKFNLEEGELAALSNHPARHKRSADHFIETPSDRTRATLENMDYNYFEPRGLNYHPYSAQGVYDGPSAPSIHLDAQISSSSQNYHHLHHHPSSSSASYDRWAPENSSTTAFQGTLSTSVLPQIYSTGLVDDRAGASTARVHSQLQSEQNRPGHTTRYPQYWHDYSTSPQLGTAYGNYQDPNAGSVGVSVPQQQQQQQSAPSQLYLSEHYNMYNNLPPLNR